MVSLLYIRYYIIIIIITITIIISSKINYNTYIYI